MNHETWIKLSPEQQRIKVAELCGWRKYAKKQPGTNATLYWHRSDLCDHGNPRCFVLEHLPDYLNDLNAMHEAEKLFRESHGHRMEYAEWLNVINTESEPVFSTAAQRAEAFVLTMELE